MSGIFTKIPGESHSTVNSAALDAVLKNANQIDLPGIDQIIGRFFHDVTNAVKPVASLASNQQAKTGTTSPGITIATHLIAELTAASPSTESINIPKP